MRLLPAILALLASAAAAGEPRYRLPDGFSPSPATAVDRPDELVRRSIATIVDRGPVWDRHAARRILATIGEAALPALAATLDEGDRRTRRDLVAVLADIEGAAAFGLLMAAAGDDSWGVRETAAHGLGLHRRAAAVPVLLEQLEDPVWKIRLAAVIALRRLAETTEGADVDAIHARLAERLEDRDRDVRRAAADALLRLGHVPSLGPAFDVFRPGTRLDRLAAIRELPVTDSPAVLELLRDSMGDSDPRIAFVAAERYAAIRGLEVLEVAGMRERLRQTILMRSDGAAIAVLRRLRTDALPFLVETLRLRGSDLRQSRTGFGGSEPKVRRLLDLIASIGGTEAVPVFRRIIEEEKADDFLVKQAIEVGRLVFPKSLEAAFRKRLLDRREIVYYIHGLLLRALAASNPEAAATPLAEAAASGTRDLQLAVLDVVESLGTACDRDDLLTAIITSSGNLGVLRRAFPMAGRALGRAAEPLILPRLEDPDLRIRAAAAGAMTSERSETVARALRALFDEVAPGDDDEPEVLERKESIRLEILNSLPLVAPAPDLTFLHRALRAEDFRVREAAARGLRHDPTEESAAVVLWALDREEDPTVRQALMRTLVSSPGKAVDDRIAAILREGERTDRMQVLSGLQHQDRPVPSVVRDGVLTEMWDPGIRSAAATVLVRRGDESDLTMLVKLLAEGAPLEVELVILSALGERKAVEQVPGLVGLLPTGQIADVDPGRHDFVNAVLICLGRIGDPSAAAGLRDLLARARPGPETGLADLLGFREDCLALAAGALARVDPEGALPDLLGLALDPVLARLDRENGEKKPLLSIRAVCAGLQRVPDPILGEAVGRTLAEGIRAGHLLELPPEYLRRLEILLKDPKHKRPRKKTAGRIRATMLRLPPTVSAVAVEVADDQATHEAFFGTPENIEWTARRALRLVLLSPGPRKPPAQRRKKAALFEALALTGRGAVALRDGRTEEGLARFDEAARVDENQTNLAYYLAWTGILRNVPLDRIRVWADRAAMLSADEQDTRRSHVLHLTGMVRWRSGNPEGAEPFLRRAWMATDRRKGGALFAYHLGLLLFGLGLEEDGRGALLKALEKDDNYWSMSRREPALQPLRESGELEELIEKAAATFD